MFMAGWMGDSWMCESEKRRPFAGADADGVLSAGGADRAGGERGYQKNGKEGDPVAETLWVLHDFTRDVWVLILP
jgi:hypothetical protein